MADADLDAVRREFAELTALFENAARSSPQVVKASGAIVAGVVNSTGS